MSSKHTNRDDYFHANGKFDIVKNGDKHINLL